ncbi:uncharacterized protein LOC124363742 [Homalodisca vitripennis]|uniref:uncharacterized protein LOC124363742 n=1 Tax=Homalodisca vitripennis TaxID=197043 RepID=UPI001EE9FE54|nr:uncharacterized protein LOC124363742 [Homalodisca vitripennis]
MCEILYLIRSLMLDTFPDKIPPEQRDQPTRLRKVCSEERPSKKLANLKEGNTLVVPSLYSSTESLSEDAFGPTLEKRGGREKRLLKTLGIGALGVKAAKAVGTKVVAAGAKAVGAKVLKTGAAVKAATLGAVGLKAKAIGAKAVTAVVALGIKALIFKLLFGLTKSSLQPRKQPVATSTTAPGEEGEIPEFDPNKISLQVPDEVFAPAFNSVNSISTIIGNLIQNTAERVARLVERLKPLFRSSLGFRSRKRQTEQAEDSPLDEDKDNETTFFTDETQEIQETAGSESEVQTFETADIESEVQTSETADEPKLRSPIRSSYAALVNNS